MGIKADTFNKVVDVLKTEVAGGGSLTRFKKVIVGELNIVQASLPILVVKLPDIDISNEEWRATTNRRQEFFRVNVVIITAQNPDNTFPYGESGAKPGFLVDIDDVQNAIENNYAAICGVSSKTLDVTTLVAQTEKDDGSKTWQATLVVEFKNAFIQGDR